MVRVAQGAHRRPCSDVYPRAPPPPPCLKHHTHLVDVEGEEDVLPSAARATLDERLAIRSVVGPQEVEVVHRARAVCVGPLEVRHTRALGGTRGCRLPARRVLHRALATNWVLATCECWPARSGGDL